MSKQSFEVKGRSTATTEAEAWKSRVRDGGFPAAGSKGRLVLGQESCWDPKSYQCASQRNPSRRFHHCEGSSGQKLWFVSKMSFHISPTNTTAPWEAACPMSLPVLWHCTSGLVWVHALAVGPGLGLLGK